MLDITVKIGGQAGFGIMTIGQFLGKIATRCGFHAFEYPEYPSLIRGGLNVVQVRISDEKVYSQEEKADILVCLSQDAYKEHICNLKKGGVVIYDQETIDISKFKPNSEKIEHLNISFNRILENASLNKVMINNIALGVLMHVLGTDIEVLNELIRQTFAKKSQEIIEKNILAAKLGFESAQKSYPKMYSKNLIRKKEFSQKMYISGNEIIGLGAIAAGCKLYVAYPMTPSSTLLHYLASQAEKSQMVVKHAEDEISVINMALGGAWAGVRSMVGTSGGGFALMVESVALAGISETPIVIMMGQRPGPATGMPTWTEQGDLLFIVNAGHGEFPKIVLSPGDAEEAYKLTIEAFNLAEKYQTPVFILSDKYLLEGHQSVEKDLIANYKYKIDRGKLLSEEELGKINHYLRYQITADGISPRALPGYKGSLQQANSYEHLEDGHTTEDPVERKKQVEKRNKKNETFLAKDFQMPVLFGRQDAPLTVISWGSMKGPILQAMKESLKFNYLHFSYLWPLPQDRLSALFKNLKKCLLIENNSTAQLGRLLKMITGLEIENKLLKYSGRPIYPHEVLAKVEELIKR